jgi:hypothetical protein
MISEQMFIDRAAEVIHTHFDPHARLVIVASRFPQQLECAVVSGKFDVEYDELDELSEELWQVLETHMGDEFAKGFYIFYGVTESMFQNGVITI